MRFITEYELLTDFEIKNYKGLRQWGTAQALGTDIAKAFGWKERGYHDQRGGNDIKRYSLEIEAFPMDKWVEFKQRLFEYIQITDTMVSLIPIVEMVKELESFGKPAGEAKP
jgi:hypothetical protein